jgi:hypothetical protein
MNVVQTAPCCPTKSGIWCQSHYCHVHLAAVTLSVRHVLSEVDITVIGLAAGHVLGTSLTLLLYITIFIYRNTFLHKLQLADGTNILFSCLARRSTTGLAVSCRSRGKQILSHQEFIAAKLLYRLHLTMCAWMCLNVCETPNMYENSVYV